MTDSRSYTQPAISFLVGPPDAPDEVVDVKDYNRAMDALTNADARVTELEAELTLARRVVEKADQLVTNVMTYMELGADEAMEYGFDELDDALTNYKGKQP